MKTLFINTIRFLIILIFIFSAGFIKTACSEDISTIRFIQEYTEHIKKNRWLEFNGESVSAVDVIPAFYETRGYRPAWNVINIRDQLAEINNISKDGLNPSDYHISLLTDLLKKVDRGESIAPRESAYYDIFFTDSLLRLSYHLRYGKVDPELLDPNWNLPKISNKIQQQALINDVLNSGTINKYVEGLKPSHFYYQRMKSALARYKKIKHEGGWNRIQSGPALRPGMTGDRVAGLRMRLRASGDMDDESYENPALFDESLEIGVKEFQKRHGLIVDGIVGPQTIKAMNISVDKRIDQIRVNLERARWVLQDLPSKFVVVNIAGFTAFYVKDGDPVWISKVVVGRTYRKTPVFRAEMKYIVFNPTWTVPPIILRKDILPAVKADPSYLAERHIRVLDSNGTEVSQKSINWSAYTWKNFPYILRQDPGPENALGLIKFVFPNKHFVFLHDTPAKSLFEKDIRTFSSGCIRIEKPFELAELLLDNSHDWNSSTIGELIARGITTTVTLQKPVPILVLYWTSRVNENGKVEFLHDVYHRDAAVLLELDTKFN